jgi:NTE family protein
LALLRPDKSLARFERIALVLSGGAALGAYQAGAYAALESSGVRPNWIAASAIGAVNAAIIAGSLPHERVIRLRRFWQELSRQALRYHARSPGRWARAALRQWPWRRPRRGWVPVPDEPIVPAGELRALLHEVVDFDRVNAGTVRLVLGTVNLATGTETFFDNDRHVLGPEHVLAGTPLPGLPPVTIDRQLYGGSAVSVCALEEARPADTLCFAINGYDPVPGHGGISRAAREIAAVRRVHDLRRMIALLGERLPGAMRGDADIRKCLAEASNATITILHLVQETSAADLAAKMADFSPSALQKRWHAGENDVATGLAHPLWLAPPPRRLGVVVHEVRGGVAAPPR